MKNTKVEDWKKGLREWVYAYNRNNKEANWITESQHEWLLVFVRGVERKAEKRTAEEIEKVIISYDDDHMSVVKALRLISKLQSK